jgi:2-dehydropantoate 2-reductase
MRIAIVGAGALGCYYGSMLAKQGYDVHFLMRRDYESVKKYGLRVKSCNGDFLLHPVQCYQNPTDIKNVDLVFIGLKTTSNDQYEPLITPLLAPHTRILTAQNGLGNEEQLAGLFGPDRISGGLAFLCANREDPGVLVHLRYGQMNIGNFNRPVDPFLDTFSEMLNRSGVNCQTVDNLSLARWQKLIWNVPFNGLSAWYNMTVDTIVKVPHLRQQCMSLMREIQAAAASYGLVIADEFLDKMMSYTDALDTYYTSMQLDRIHHRKMEIESILGQPLGKGQHNGIPMPHTEMLYNNLKNLHETL